MRHFVVQPQRFFEVVVVKDVEDRREGFVAHHIRLARHLGDSRRDVVGVGELRGQLAFAAEDHATLVAGLGQCALHGVEALLVDQRTDQVVFSRIADAHLGIGRFHPCHDFVLHRAMDDQAAQGGATLAGGADGGKEDAAHRQAQVGARREDHGVVAAQFKNAAAEARRHLGTDLATHASAAGGTDQRNARVVHKYRAGLAIADYQLTQARRGGAERFHGNVEQGLAGQCSERGFLGRLPDHGIATNQRQGRVPGPDRGGEVEGADHADHTQRMPGLAHMVAGALGGDGKAVELARQTNGEVADIDHFLHFTQAFLGDLAGFDGDQFAQLDLVLAQDLTVQPDQLAPARGGYVAPGQKGLVSRFDLAQDCRRAFQGDRCDPAAIDRGVNGMVAPLVCAGIDAKAFEQLANHVFLLHRVSGCNR
ncbi:hypothetical protein D3C85_882070 [compost metagenome]